MTSAVSTSPALSATAVRKAILPNFRLACGTWLSTLAVISLAGLLGTLFLQEPGFGDDFTYWSLAFDLRMDGSHAWSAHSFHDLRWPIWGLCWLVQGLIGSGLPSYYLPALLYLAAAALLARAFGQKTLGTTGGSWVCVVALLFQPLLNAIIFRPMPDLVEGIFGACAFLAWWRMLESRPVGMRICFGLLSGLSIGLAFSTRVTGVFIAPVLLLGTLLYYRSQWRWLLLPAAVSLTYFLAEGAFYHAICGDWWHGLTVNLANRGVKGTEPLSLWKLPVRYLGDFIRGDRLAPIYAGLMLWGLRSAWMSGRVLNRLIVWWFVVSYLEYSCAIQSLHPVRPLIGGAVRYLATLAIPASLLAAFGAYDLALRFGQFRHSRLTSLQRVLPSWRPSFAVGLLLLLAAFSSRPWTDLGYLTPLRRYLAQVPAGTPVFTHRAMRDLVFLAAPEKARELSWTAPKSILAGSTELERAAVAGHEFWYIRKLLWLTERKKVDRGVVSPALKLASYVQTPEKNWRLSEVLSKNNGEPEIVFYQRRRADRPAPLLLPLTELHLTDVAPSFPLHFSAQGKRKSLGFQWDIPPALQGRLVRLEATGASTSAEPVTVRLRFRRGKLVCGSCLFKPIFLPAGGLEFLPLRFPAGAEQCDVTLNFNPEVKQFALTDLRAVTEATP